MAKSYQADVPGGVVDTGIVDSIFGFLNDPDKYLTFGATAPITMSWTSTVSDTRAFTTELSMSRSMYNLGYNFDIELQIVVLKLQAMLENNKEEVHTIQIGKSSESTHSFERTISVTLDDSDVGKYSILVHVFHKDVDILI